MRFPALDYSNVREPPNVVAVHRRRPAAMNEQAASMLMRVVVRCNGELGGAVTTPIDYHSLDQVRHFILAIVVLVWTVGALRAQSFCTGAVDGTATIQLASPPYAQFSTRIELSEFYGSGATLGPPQATVTGSQIQIAQANNVAWSLPTITCRVHTIDVGTLSPGRYEVTWTTAETLSPPLNPPTRTRIRTFAFVILPAEAIPAADQNFLVLLVLVLAGVGLARSWQT
jgi:hypothetical protein